MGFHAGWEQPDWYSTDDSKPEYKPNFYRFVVGSELITFAIGTNLMKFLIQSKQSVSMNM